MPRFLSSAICMSHICSMVSSAVLSVISGLSGVAGGTVGGDEGDHGDHARVSKELGHLGRTADRLVAIGVGEAQIVGEAGAQVVAVDAVDGLAHAEEQLLLERLGDGGLAG